MTKTPKISEADLRQFAGGTEHYYRHPLNRKIMFTDGVKYIPDEAGAYWFVDLIALAQHHRQDLKNQPFQVWVLAVLPDHSATITVEDGNYNLVFKQQIPWTDFPAEGVTVWFAGDVIYLPVEH
jgi:hypothetical protein